MDKIHQWSRTELRCNGHGCLHRSRRAVHDRPNLRWLLQSSDMPASSMTCIVLALTMCIGAHSSVPAVTSAPDDEVTAADLSDLIERWMAPATRFETQIKLVVSPNHSVGSPVPSPDEWQRREQILVRVLPQQVAIETRSEARDAASDAPSPVELEFWDGTVVQRTMIDSGAIVLAREIGAGDMFSKSWIFNRIEGRFPSFTPLSRIVREGTPIQQRVDDGILRYRISSSWSDAVQYEVLARLEPTFRLEGVALEMFDTDDLDKLLVRQVFNITDWTEFEGIEMPQSAVLRSESFQDPSGTDETNAFSAWYERETLVAIEADSRLDRGQFDLQPGVGVVDQRIGLSFVVGEARFVLDGTVYEAVSPLNSPPGDRLPEIVAGATMFAPREQPVLSGALAAGDGLAMWRVLLAMASACIVGVVLLWYIRHRSRGVSG